MTASQLGRSYRHVGVHYTEWVKKFVSWNLRQQMEPQATN